MTTPDDLRAAVERYVTTVNGRDPVAISALFTEDVTARMTPALRDGILTGALGSDAVWISPQPVIRNVAAIARKEALANRSTERDMISL